MRCARRARENTRQWRRAKSGELQRFAEQLDAVLLDRLEQVVARDAVAGFHDDERLVDERGHAVENVFDLERCAGAHGLRRLERKAPGEHGESTQQLLFAMVEQAVAPIHRAAQRAMPRQRRATSARQQTKGVVQSSGDLVGRQHAHARRREFDGERNSVESFADVAERAVRWRRLRRTTEAPPARVR